MQKENIRNMADYYMYISEIVDSIEEEYGNYPETEMYNLVESHVDNNQMIIYNGYHTTILDNSRNEPEEWKHMVGEDSSYHEVLQAMAYDVMKQDVWEEINDRDISY